MSNTTPLSTGRSEGDARRLSLRGAKRFADEEAILERNRQFIGRADGQNAAAYKQRRIAGVGWPEGSRI